MTKLIAAIHAIAIAITKLLSRIEAKEAQQSADRIARDPGAEWVRRFGKENETAPPDARKPVGDK